MTGPLDTHGMPRAARNEMHWRPLACHGRIVLAAFAVGSALTAQSWRAVATPSGRVLHSLAYDLGRGRTVLFGGFPSSNDTWEFDGAGWRHTTTATRPAARWDHALAFDISRGRTVLYGGWDAGTAFGDTWEFDGSNWTQVLTPQSPGPRASHGLVFDMARNRTVLFSGWSGTLGLAAETWEYDGVTWTRSTTVNSPPPRWQAGMCHDLVRGRTVLHGGLTAAASSLTDTWEYDGVNWTQVATASVPAGRDYTALAFDIFRNRTVLFAGGPETWDYDGVDWRLSTAVAPPAVEGHALAFDVARGRTILFGGGINECLADTWTYDGSSWTQVGAGPSVRNGPSVVHDPVRGRTVLFGGEPVWPPWLGCAGTCFLPVGDTWECDGRSWRLMNPAAAPSARAWATITYDTRRRRSILFGGLAPGGRGGGGFDVNDTWEHDGSNWSQVTTSMAPTARSGHAMTFDQARGRVVMSGGWSRAGMAADTWEYDGVNWTQVATATTPPSRRQHALAFDTARMRTVLFGGIDAAGSSFADTWEYDGTTWTQLATPLAPPARAGHAMTFDPARAVIVLTGGRDFALGIGYPDTWELAGSVWTRSAANAIDGGQALTFDPDRGRALLFGPGLSELVESAVPTWTRLGRGCQGSAGTPSLDAANAAPALGAPFPLQLTMLPGSPGAVFLGFGLGIARWNGSALPVDLGPWGLPGCELWMEPAIGLLVTHPGSACTFPLAIPANPVLAGLLVPVQALVLDAAAANGGSLTNAGLMRLY